MTLGLVLSGGGARAAYQVGVLSLLGERAPELRFPIITGVSAGAINAGLIASAEGALGESASQLKTLWESLTIDEIFDARLSWILGTGLNLLRSAITGRPTPALRSLVDTTPLNHFLDANIDADGIAANVKAKRLRALGVTTTCYDTGETITFVHGQREIPMWHRAKRRSVATTVGVPHLMASAAIPLVFPAIPIGGIYYGDGSMRQAAPLAPSIHLGAARIFAIAMRYVGDLQVSCAADAYPSPSQIMGLLLNSVFLDALDADIERLERVNRLLEPIPSDEISLEILRPIELFVIRPSTDITRLVGRGPRRLPFALRVFGRLLGMREARAATFASYLLFEEAYVSRLVELGYNDARANWDDIEQFLAD